MSAHPNFAPSRAFMVQQAVLNAAQTEWPLTETHGYRAQLLSDATRRSAVLPGWLHMAICREFRAIASRYEGAES